MLDYLNPLSDNFILKSIIDYLNPFSENFILKSVLDFLGNILSYLNPFSENFILKGVLNFLGDILNYLNPFSENFFGKKIVEWILDILEFLFVPDTTEMNEKIESIKSKFAFIDDIKETINNVTDVVYDENNSPSLSIPIPDNRTGITNVEVINLSWYSKFKSYGDVVITCFTYAIFFWRIYIKLPGIINGTAGSVEGVVDVSKRGGKE